jgi:hypothetical protein
LVAQSWSRLSDDKLLKLRFCDLKLSVEGSPLHKHVKRLHEELETQGIQFKPHVWLSDEWFTPDGVPGFAMPFYLAHPRLALLEQRMVGEAEGANARWLLRILRHEAGHAVDNAYRLRRRKCWRDVFGPASLPYPDRYRARPGSRRYVHHLGDWYAQSHPTEDFAETFAVWLKPNSNWRRVYADWPAFHKLVLVDQLITGIRGKAAPVRNRRLIDSLENNTCTLEQHYASRAAHHGHYRRGAAEELLTRVFSSKSSRAVAPQLSVFLHAERARLVQAVADDLAVERYTVQQVLRILIERSEHLNLYISGGRRAALRHARWVLTRITRLYAQSATPQFIV